MDSPRKGVLLIEALVTQPAFPVIYDDETQPPQGPGLLADFIGESSRGEWRLEITPRFSGPPPPVVGTVLDFTLRLTPENN